MKGIKVAAAVIAPVIVFCVVVLGAFAILTKEMAEQHQKEIEEIVHFYQKWAVDFLETSNEVDRQNAEAVDEFWAELRATAPRGMMPYILGAELRYRLKFATVKRTVEIPIPEFKQKKSKTKPDENRR